MNRKSIWLEENKMGELLIKRQKHWAEDSKPANWSTLKWNSRLRQGDIIEVREDGYYRVEYLKEGIHGWNRNAFALIRIPGVNVKDLKYAGESYSNGTELSAETVFYKRRYRLVLWEQMSWNKNQVIIPESGNTFEEWYKDFGVTGIFTSALTDKVI
jgi:hypothetical protein